MFVQFKTDDDRLDLEEQVLAAAFKQSYENGDKDAAALAHAGLKSLMQARLFGGPMNLSVDTAVPAGPKLELDRETADPGEPSGADPGPELRLADDLASPVVASEDHKPSATEAQLHDQVAQKPQAWKLFEPQVMAASSFYDILGVHNTSSFEQIHQQFFRTMRALFKLRNQQQLNSTLGVRDFRYMLRQLCVAHDILRDPVTRTDYDLRLLGLRQPTEVTEETPGDVSTRARLMLGELLEATHLMEKAELEIALDMHKAMKEMPFGQFLVKAAFLTQDELDSALIAQKLISIGKITVNQFQYAIARLRNDDVSFFDTLVLEGWIQAHDLFSGELEIFFEFGVAEEEPAEPGLLLDSEDMMIEQMAQQAVENAQKEVADKAGNGGNVPEWQNNMQWSDQEPAASFDAGDRGSLLALLNPVGSKGMMHSIDYDPATAKMEAEILSQPQPAEPEAKSEEKLPAETESQPEANAEALANHKSEDEDKPSASKKSEPQGKTGKKGKAVKNDSDTGQSKDKPANGKQEEITQDIFPVDKETLANALAEANASEEKPEEEEKKGDDVENTLTGEETELTAVQAAAVAAAEQEWTQEDSMSETQTIDVRAVKAALEAKKRGEKQ